MFKFAKEAWFLVDLNEPEISEYSIKEFFKLAVILITAILTVSITIDIFAEKQIDQLLTAAIIMFWLVCKTPLYLTLGLNLLKGNRFRVLNQKKIKSKVKSRTTFFASAFFYCVIIFCTQLYGFKENNTIFYLLNGLVIAICIGSYLLTSYFVLFLEKSLLSALLLSCKLLITKTLTILKILIFDLIPGFYVLLINEFIKRCKRPLTFVSYISFGLRLIPYMLISACIICREIWGIQDISISIIHESQDSEIQDDSIHIGLASVNLDVNKSD